jgi:hypothetical protein
MSTPVLRHYRQMLKAGSCYPACQVSAIVCSGNLGPDVVTTNSTGCVPAQRYHRGDERSRTALKPATNRASVSEIAPRGSMTSTRENWPRR